MIEHRQPDVVTVAVSRVDGGVTVLRVITAEYEPDGIGGRKERWRVEPTAQYIDALLAKYEWTGPQAALSWRLVPNDYVDETTDRTFRNAWKDEGGRKPGHDMPKAREIHRDRLRRLRAPLLETLDADYMRADEAGDQKGKKDIAARKQALRDVTADQRIDAAQTLEELKALTIEALSG